MSSNPIQRTSRTGSNNNDSDIAASTNEGHHIICTNPLGIEEHCPRRRNHDPPPRHDKSNTGPIYSSGKPNINPTSTSSSTPLSSPSFQSLCALAFLSLSPKKLNSSPKQIKKSSSAERSEVMRDADAFKSKQTAVSEPHELHNMNGEKHSDDGDGCLGPLALPPTLNPTKKCEPPRIETEVSATARTEIFFPDRRTQEDVSEKELTSLPIAQMMPLWCSSRLFSSLDSEKHVSGGTNLVDVGQQFASLDSGSTKASPAFSSSAKTLESSSGNSLRHEAGECALYFLSQSKNTGINTNHKARGQKHVSGGTNLVDVGQQFASPEEVLIMSVRPPPLAPRADSHILPPSLAVTADKQNNPASDVRSRQSNPNEEGTDTPTLSSGQFHPRNDHDRCRRVHCSSAATGRTTSISTATVMTSDASAFSEAGDESAHSLAPFADNGTFAFMDVGSEDIQSPHSLPSHVAVCEQRGAWFGIEHSCSQRETSRRHFAKKNSKSSNESATVNNKISADGIESGSSASFRGDDGARANVSARCHTSITQTPANLQKSHTSSLTTCEEEEGGSNTTEPSIKTVVAAAYSNGNATAIDDLSVTRMYNGTNGGPSSASVQHTCTKNGVFDCPSDERKREQQDQKDPDSEKVRLEQGVASFRSSLRSPGLVSLWSASPQLVSRTNANAASYVQRLPNDQHTLGLSQHDNKPNRVVLAPHKKTEREKNDISSISASPSQSSSPPVFYSVTVGSGGKVDIAARGQQHSPVPKMLPTSGSSRPASALLTAVTSQPSMVPLCGLPLILCSATANRNSTHKKNHVMHENHTCTCACLISKHANPNPFEPNETTHHHHRHDAGGPSPMLSNAPTPFVSLPAPPSYFFRPFGGSFDLKNCGKPTLEQQILEMAKQQKKADEKKNKYTPDGQACKANGKEQGQPQSSPPVIVREVFNEGLSLNSPAQEAAPAKSTNCAEPQNEEVNGSYACGGMMTLGSFASFRLGVSPSTDVPREINGRFGQATSKESPTPLLGGDPTTNANIADKLVTAGHDVSQKKQTEGEKRQTPLEFASSPSPKFASTRCDDYDSPAGGGIALGSLTTITSTVCSKTAIPRILDRRLPFLIGHDTEFRTSSTVATDIRTDSGNDSAVPKKLTSAVANEDIPNAHNDVRKKERNLTSVGGEDRGSADNEVEEEGS